MNRVLSVWLMRLFLCGVLWQLQIGAAAPPDKVSAGAPASNKQVPDGKVSLNFVNADIDEVVRAISQITSRNFLIDPRVKGTINIVSSTPIPAHLAYDIFLSALRLQGFAAVESGGITKVMPEAEAKLHITNVDDTTKGDKLVTRVYALKYESAAQMVPILRPLIAPNNVVMAYPNSNVLVVTDYASNLKRVEQIIKSIDQASTEGPIIIPLKRASAIEMAQIITRLMMDGGAAAADPSTRFVLGADTRTNSLLLRTDNPSRVTRVRDLAERLDIDTGRPGNMNVVYLKNADAVKLAQTLRAVVSGDASSSTLPAGGVAAGIAATGAGAVGGGMIQADSASNALIITAPAAVYNNLRAVVELLDVRRAQVFVEALIVEVTADKAAEFGIQWQDLTGLNGTGSQVIGGTNFGAAGVAGGNIISASGNIASSVSKGLNIGIVNGTTTLPGVGTVLNLGVLARALETDANANILSTPNLLTLDNEEAKILIGQNVPFITGSQLTTGANANPFQTIERKDVGLTLRIKPQISEGGTVKLQIFQEVSNVDSLTNAAGVITNKRSLESTVLVNDGQIIALGGLIQDSVKDSTEKVPFLGDIPFLGALFRYEKRQHNKTNLMVFIRPYVLRTASASQGLTQERYEYLLGEQERGRVSGHAILPDMPAPTMPPLVLQEPPKSPPAEVVPSTVQNTAAEKLSPTSAEVLPGAVSIQPGEQIVPVNPPANPSGDVRSPASVSP
ncbi:MAG: type II secretion system secretin GspD [Candidatus Nitrotoga sp.]